MDITHTCIHCCRGTKVFRIRGVQRMKKFEFKCDYCSRKSFFDFYRFSHPDVILLLKRFDRKQNELLDALNRIIDILEKYVNS